jgi:hypothetical protein
MFPAGHPRLGFSNITVNATERKYSTKYTKSTDGTTKSAVLALADGPTFLISPKQGYSGDKFTRRDAQTFVERVVGFVEAVESPQVRASLLSHGTVHKYEGLSFGKRHLSNRTKHVKNLADVYAHAIIDHACNQALLTHSLDPEPAVPAELP